MKKTSAWFRSQGFRQVVFQKKVEYITTYWLGQPVLFKLARRKGYTTFYSQSVGGSLLIFEVSIQDSRIVYDGYCPILLFGMWNIKLSFKREANWIFKYRSKGYAIQEKFEQYLETKTIQDF